MDFSALKEKLLSRAELRGIKLSSRELVIALSDLKRWRAGLTAGRRGVVMTRDGTPTLISESYGEPYHSISA
jgi:hypothetical protein